MKVKISADNRGEINRVAGEKTVLLKIYVPLNVKNSIGACEKYLKK
jgi:hypothetical protein